MKVLCIETK